MKIQDSNQKTFKASDSSQAVLSIEPSKAPSKTPSANHEKAPHTSPTKMVRLQPSRYGLYLILFLLFIAALSVWLADIPIYLQILLFIVVLFHVKLAYAKWQGTPVYRVQYLHGAWWLLAEGNGLRRRDYKIEGWSYWSRWFLVLKVVDRLGKRGVMPVVFDCCSVDEFRWFRVVVKIYKKPKS